jgi:hypothetical protein
MIAPRTGRLFDTLCSTHARPPPHHQDLGHAHRYQMGSGDERPVPMPRHEKKATTAEYPA